ncbi:hypothetical protein N7931_14630 [Catenovulum sp. 2E275]|uniref:hypothetical protein n=1 Tax=Catenovulum sp. 2E275 TaxID=2980497 RepID=UPI0021D2999A|nr:hypothetical protein [Catenovulum sp. 2E275]MCU4676866.1 hypothetical protein [Catenovulum sp. 2E275]
MTATPVNAPAAVEGTKLETFSPAPFCVSFSDTSPDTTFPNVEPLTTPAIDVAAEVNAFPKSAALPSMPSWIIDSLADPTACVRVLNAFLPIIINFKFGFITVIWQTEFLCRILTFTKMVNFHAAIFSSLFELDFLTQSLDSLNSNQTCQHCACSDSWISHGFIYRQSGLKVGKRILCAKRYGKSGCGRTLALYLADVIPNRRYSFSVIWALVLSLQHGSTVEQAYYLTIGHCHFSHRQAYPWLSALYAQLGFFRSWLAQFNSECLSIVLCVFAPLVRQFYYQR